MLPAERGTRGRHDRLIATFPHNAGNQYSAAAAAVTFGQNTRLNPSA